ncbi:MAG: DUF2336 domain-containing protein [Rhodospirillaceae bacterium]|nr:DUF2336 domain-containing protein [Rhodospirillaceae bacterium]
MSNSTLAMLGLGGETGSAQLHRIKLSDYLKIEEKLSAEQKTALAVFLAHGASAQDQDQLDESGSIIQLIIWSSDSAAAESVAGSAVLNADLPRHILWMLANDDERVAAPVLEKSAALTEEDLLGIIQWSGNPGKMNSIARRDAVSETVVHALACHGDETVARTLLENSGAMVSADAFDVVLDRFGEIESIQAAIAGREIVSSAVAQRLLSVITNPEIGAVLAARETAPPSNAASPARFGAIGLDFAESEQTLDSGLNVLVKDGALTEPALVELLLDGGFELFVRAFARRTQSDPKDTRRRLVEETAEFLPLAWKTAAFSEDWLPIARAAMLALIELRDATGSTDPKLFRRNLYALTGAILRREGVKLTGARLDFFVRHKPK